MATSTWLLSEFFQQHRIRHRVDRAVGHGSSLVGFAFYSAGARRGRLQVPAPEYTLESSEAPTPLPALPPADIHMSRVCASFRAPNSLFVCACIVMGCFAATAAAQDASTREEEAARRRQRVDAVCNALGWWHHDYARRQFRLDQKVALHAGAPHKYVKIGAEHRLFGRRRGQQCTHFTALQLLIAAAERHAGERVTAALLPLAAAGFGRGFYYPEIVQVRDAAHSAILRMDHPATWKHVQRVARESSTEDIGPRIAALRLLGMKRVTGFRTAVERALRGSEPRVRIAAAEALGQIRPLATPPMLSSAIEKERHPIVALALIDAADRILRRRGAKIAATDWTPFVRACMRNLGRAGWRSDLATVRLVRRYPIKSAVPTLIELLRGTKTEDPMLKIVNRDASPLLAHEAWLTLRRVAGALLPQDADKWQEFWQKEKTRVVLPAPPHRRAAREATRAKGAFFGIPVVGREVVFVIDTSHSMRDPIDPLVGGGKAAKIVQRLKLSRRKSDERWTRLDAAKEQVLVAVAGMNDATSYNIVTFSDKVYSWYDKPVPARRRSLRALMKILDRVQPAGFTNTFAALQHVFSTPDLRVDEVFILSDGEPSVGAVQETGKILEAVRKLNRYQQIRINTVFTGRGDGAKFMRELAEQNHGVFVHYGH